MKPTTDAPPRPSSSIRVEGSPVTLFGHPSTPARLTVRARSRRWRLRKALVPLAVALVVGPVVAIVPPHAPWVLIALAAGGLLAWRRWKEDYTVVDFRACCPRCDADLHVPSGTPLRFPHPLTCDACRHEPVLKVDPDELESRPG